jgi:hypothetical protein
VYHARVSAVVPLFVHNPLKESSPSHESEMPDNHKSGAMNCVVVVAVLVVVAGFVGGGGT